MNELQSENEKPLLIVKYVWWKILWKLFFPISFGLLIAGGLVHNSMQDILLGCKDASCSVLYTAFILWSFVFIMSVFLLIATSLFREIKIYSNRLEQKWYIFGKREIIFQNAYLITSRFPPFSAFILVKPKDKFHLLYCYMDESLLSKSDREKVLSILSEISNRNINDFRNKGKTTFDPFIKN